MLQDFKIVISSNKHYFIYAVLLQFPVSLFFKNLPRSKALVKFKTLTLKLQSKFHTSNTKTSLANQRELALEGSGSEKRCSYGNHIWNKQA